MNGAIIIPSISLDALLLLCVTECRRLCPDTEIIVLVDHEEGQKSLDAVAKVIVTGPISIAAKRNIGAKITSADYLAFIDSDAYPEKGWLENAIAILEAEHIYGAVGGPNISPPVEKPSERCVGLAHNSFLVTGWWAYRRNRHAQAREVGALPSCNLIVRSSDYRAVGGMNENLFTAEDTDFCSRFTKSGRRIYFSPDVLVYHKNRKMIAFVVQRFTFGLAIMERALARCDGSLYCSGLCRRYTTVWSLERCSRNNSSYYRR